MSALVPQTQHNTKRRGEVSRCTARLPARGCPVADIILFFLFFCCQADIFDISALMVRRAERSLTFTLEHRFITAPLCRLTARLLAVFPWEDSPQPAIARQNVRLGRPSAASLNFPPRRVSSGRVGGEFLQDGSLNPPRKAG